MKLPIQCSGEYQRKADVDLISKPQGEQTLLMEEINHCRLTDSMPS
jgi:hypothetical protein